MISSLRLRPRLRRRLPVQGVAARLAAAFLVSLSAGAATDRPNVLWLVADDLGVELGCYGEPVVATPHIDGLASEGVRFTQAFATSPVCSPSRSAFITGMYQTGIGAHHHRTEKPAPLPGHVRPVTEHFRRAGYYVTNGTGEAGAEAKKAKTDYNFYVRNEDAMFDGADWSTRAEGQPFFAQVQFAEPHRPFPVVGDDVVDAAKVRLPPMYPDHPVARADWRNYLAAIEVLDGKVGAVLDRLEAEGLKEDTVVLFFGDHGRPHLRGNQWLYDEGLHVPLIVRWPGNARLKAGTENGWLVSLLDLAPASLAAAGIAVPANMHGENFLSGDWIGRAEIFAARDRCGDAIDRIRCVRTSRFKYIRNFMPELPYMQHSGDKKLDYPMWPLMEVLHAEGKLTGAQRLWMLPRKWEEELYDLRSDPHELASVADEPDYAGVLAELRGKVDAWIEATGDRGAEPEGDARFMRDLMNENRRYYEKAMKKRQLAPGLAPWEYLRWWEYQLNLK